MPKHALMEKRPWLLASLTAALAWYVSQDAAWPEPYLIALKGAGVALLAIWALLRHAGADSRMLAAIMALGAMGDMAIELWLEAGAAFFLAGHAIAIALYLRHRRERLSLSQKLAALALLALTPVISFLLTASPLVALYAVGLGAMAAAAWSSSFNRYRVGLGAVLFVVSDLLIFAGMGPLSASPLPDLLIWPLYYCGQLLICTGVIATLRRQAD